jgi:hypothetical protein
MLTIKYILVWNFLSYYILHTFYETEIIECSVIEGQMDGWKEERMKDRYMMQTYIQGSKLAHVRKSKTSKISGVLVKIQGNLESVFYWLVNYAIHICMVQNLSNIYQGQFAWKIA